ncbi:unnamed protein product, partial [Effrenium voratum]
VHVAGGGVGGAGAAVSLRLRRGPHAHRLSGASVGVPPEFGHGGYQGLRLPLCHAPGLRVPHALAALAGLEHHLLPQLLPWHRQRRRCWPRRREAGDPRCAESGRLGRGQRRHAQLDHRGGRDTPGADAAAFCGMVPRGPKAPVHCEDRGVVPGTRRAHPGRGRVLLRRQGGQRAALHRHQLQRSAGLLRDPQRHAGPLRRHAPGGAAREGRLLVPRSCPSLRPGTPGLEG